MINEGIIQRVIGALKRKVAGKPSASDVLAKHEDSLDRATSASIKNLISNRNSPDSKARVERWINVHGKRKNVDRIKRVIGIKDLEK